MRISKTKVHIIEILAMGFFKAILSSMAIHYCAIWMTVAHLSYNISKTIQLYSSNSEHMCRLAMIAH